MAQSEESRLGGINHHVRGSSPRWGARIFRPFLRKRAFFIELAEITDMNPKASFEIIFRELAAGYYTHAKLSRDNI